jgi:hypothetical protein
LRIKIEGEITAERLAEALRIAIDKFPDSVGPKFYGANLYLTVFSADGLPLEVVDEGGQPVMIRLAAPVGTLARPALTAEGAEQRTQAKEAAALQRAQQKAEDEQLEAEARERRRQRDARRATAVRSWETANRITAHLMKVRADEFVAELNNIVRSVWENEKPVELAGKRKGEVRPIPTFSSQNGTLIMSASNWKSPRRVHNPLYPSKPRDELCTFWTHSVWIESAKRIADIMTNLAHATRPADLANDSKS